MYFLWICIKFFPFVFFQACLSVSLTCPIISFECWMLYTKYCKGSGLYLFLERNWFYSIRELKDRHCDQHYPVSYLLSSFINTFKDKGNQEAQWNREVWDIEGNSLYSSSLIGHVLLKSNLKEIIVIFQRGFLWALYLETVFLQIT